VVVVGEAVSVVVVAVVPPLLFVAYGSCQKSPQPVSAHTVTHAASSQALATGEVLGAVLRNLSGKRNEARNGIRIKTRLGHSTLALRFCRIRMSWEKYDKEMLRVKLLEPGARAPEVAHPGEDLGYDVFALNAVMLAPRATVRVRTGIAVEARHPETSAALGLLVRDRSSMAARGVATTGGVIDAGYRGEILVLMTNLGDSAVELKAGEKIAQMVPVPVLTGRVEVVESLEDSARAAKGFGSSGR